jgi:hypothetical protein
VAAQHVDVVRVLGLEQPRQQRAVVRLNPMSVLRLE